MTALRQRYQAAGPVEDGLSLIEVVVSLVVFALFSTALVAALIQIQTTSRGDRMRVAAANLASAQVETLRDQPTSQITLGQQVITKTVDNLTFTLTQNVQYVQDASGNSCSSATNGIAYKRITEIVTWPGMGNIKPVRTDTLRTLNVNGLDATKGSLSVAVTGQGSSGPATPQAGVPVTVSESGYTTTTVTTGDDGCAVFVGLPAGTATATATLAGDVEPGQATSTSATASVLAGTLAKAAVTYAPAATGVFAFSSATTLPLSLTVKSSTSTRGLYDCSLTGPPCLNGQPRTVALYPASGDLVWAGTCADADPGLAANGSKTTQEVTPVLSPGATAASTTVYVGNVTVTNGNASGSKNFYAIHLADAGCAAGEAYALGSITAGAGGAKTFSLPYGKWYVTSSTSAPASYSYSATNDGTVTLTPTSGTLTASAK